MVNLIAGFFSADGFMPHGMCYLWRPGVLSLHIISDALIALAYFSIPFTLLHFVHRRRDLEFNWIFVCFAVFIVACGTTHLMEIWVIWHPTYWLSGGIKAVTALASVPTAIVLIKLVPAALRLPSPSALQKVNSELEREIVERRRAEDELRRLTEALEQRVALRVVELNLSNRRMQAVIDTAMDGVIVTDHEGYITEFSPAAEQIFGCRRSEVLGQPLAGKIIPPTPHEPHVTGFAGYLIGDSAAETSGRIEVTGRRVDGSEVPLELSISRIPGNGSPEFAGFVRDLTVRRQTEESARASQQLLEAIVDNSPAVVVVKDSDFRYVLVNRRYEEIFGLGREQVLGHTDYDLFPKELADAFRAMDERVVAADNILTDEEVAVLADGTHTYLSVKAPLRNEAGQARGLLGISTDISKRKRTEQRLQEQVERMNLLDSTTRAIAERQDLRSIFQVVIRSLEEHLPVDFACIAMNDPENHALVINCVGMKSAALALDLALSEQSRIDISQNGLSRCVHGELVYEADLAALSLPFPARLARGGLRALVIAPLRAEGKVIAVMIAARREAASFSSADCEFLRQLSEHLALATHQAQLYSSLQQAYEDLRQTQRTVMQQERLRALGQMASGIAHDINNALSPAALYAQSLLERDRTLSKDARAYLTVIQRAIEDVGRTVARMRMFYRPRESELDLLPLDLNVLLLQVAELTRARWSDMPQERGIVIDFRTELAPVLPLVMGAENELRDALTNLVLNAVDAMPQGGILTLRSSVDGSSSDQGGSVIVSVRDTGVGMTEAIRQRCLEPFFTTKGDRGTGLGLAMVYGMVQRHNAELEIDSELGTGTTVALRFAPTSLSGIAPPQAGGNAIRPLRILLVDDDPLVLRSLQDVLTSDGHTVTPIDGGQRGIDEFVAAQARGETFAAVITDLGMPDVDGRQVATAIKSASSATPVILLTGWAHRVQGDGELSGRVDRVLSKPPRLSELRQALAELTEADRPL